MDDADKAMQALVELFSKPKKTFKGRGRRYELELVSGKPTFRRDAIDLLLEDVYGPTHDDGNDIVPEKLAKIFSDTQ